VLVLLGGILAPLTGMGRMRGMPMMERQTGETSLIDETDVGEGRSSFVLA